MLSRYHNRQIWSTAILPFLDFFNLCLGAGLAYAIRYQIFEGSFVGVKRIYGAQYLAITLIVALAVILIYSILGLYRIFNKHNKRQTFININLGIWFTLFAIIAFLYFTEYQRRPFPDGITISRFIIGAVGFISMACVVTGRLFLAFLTKLSYKLGIGKINIALIGKQSSHLLQELTEREDIDRIYSFSELNLENFNKIKELIDNGELAEIYLFSLSNNEFESELAITAERRKLRFIFSPQGYGRLTAFSLKPIQIKGYYFFEMQYSALAGWGVIAKRVFDLAVSSSFIVLFSWLYALIAIAIKMDSEGPVFYMSDRVGPDGKTFKMYKFRRFKQEFCTSETKKTDAAKKALEYEQKLIKEQGEAADRGALYKIKDDPRMTKVGKFLEKTSLDEIPQFFNVFLGNLSLVGPRAHQPREVKKYAKHHFKVLNIKPGITGLAQVKGRSDLSFEEEVKHDTFYVENWNFLMDLWILVITPYIIIAKPHRS